MPWRQGRAGNLGKSRTVGGARRFGRIRRRGRVIVLESTGARLYGAVAVGGSSDGPVLESPVVSDKMDFDGAVQEVLEQLKGKSGRRKLPKKAVLITPSCAAEILSLPVDPDRSELKAQMSGMVRWELEELFLQQGDIWSPGGLLVEGGLLKPEKRYEIESSGNAGASAFEHLVSSEALDGVLAVQEKLVSGDEQLLTGWVSQGEEEGTGAFLWLAGGIGDSVRKLWVEALERHGVRLQWIYPQLGAAVPLVDSPFEKWMLIDLRREQTGLFQGAAGGLCSTAVFINRYGLVDSEQLVPFVRQSLHHDTTTVFISGPESVAGPLLDKMRQAFTGREINIFPLRAGRALSPSSISVPPHISSSMTGAASHYLQYCKKELLVRVEGHEPKPPLYKRKEIYPWLGMFVLASGFGGFDYYMKAETAKNEWALELADIEYEKKMKIKRQAQAIAGELKQFENKLHLKEKELEDARQLRFIFDNVILYRQKMVPGVLHALARSVTKGVVIDLVEENNDRSGFLIQGWAVRDTEAQFFANSLTASLQPWHYRVENTELGKGMGRMPYEGYVFRLWVKKIDSGGDG